MKTKILRYFKHLGLTILVLLLILIPVGISEGAQVSYGHDSTSLNFDGEGPYAFYKNDSLVTVKYIRGNKDDGFAIDEKDFSVNQPIPAEVYFPLDQMKFNFTIPTAFETPRSIYWDNKNILAISDIESGFKTFRDFLIKNKVIDKNLNWTFGKNHLVLLGDFVDRGFSTTQVLWLIFKVEQEAKKQGGTVHFILGNHELKNMYGDHQAASLKYTFVASMLGKTQSELYSKNAILGRWLSSKNVIESINGTLFVHGGLHPEITDLNMSIPQINAFMRKTYYEAPYPKITKDKKELLISSKTGICWYRGYFKEDLSQEEVEKPLKKFKANAIVVGHTLHFSVKKFFKGKVYGIDVQHSSDYHKNWPDYDSEALLITNGNYYRAMADGTLEKL
ncbi:metallophosphoesterase [Zunongwangia sp. SCSIO 43204]|uniref:metallophosphoesterase n=1 Tax=Zunongwangia sp. SCSIO 43204 TaxID=2779359 RepID=UPI001CA9A13F|nr:metallophosphoesterase [Zunongwangia sp. SCSIO 43204]UAB83522.1 metallophosphoesterase [Zunongwangia sp. SCSIO 43204]